MLERKNTGIRGNNSELKKDNIMGDPTVFSDDAARAARAPEVPQASFVNGTNLAASNASGIGINIGGGAVVGTPEQFTLLDQDGDARVGQRSQHIGGSGLGSGTEGDLPAASIYTGTLPNQAAKDADPALDGTVIKTGNASLADLAIGWVAA